MTVAETEALVAKIRANKSADDSLEEQLKELMLGTAVNIARIAEALDKS